MAEQKTKMNSRKVTIDGTKYSYSLKGGKATIRMNRTAKGQGMVVGVLDLKTGVWHNDDGLPTKAKNFFAALCAEK